VPRESAILGLQGGRETILRMDADHSNVCRFDPTKEVDEENFELLEVNLRRVCQTALKEGEILVRLSNRLPDVPIAGCI
jgi:hypothetical protein